MSDLCSNGHIGMDRAQFRFDTPQLAVAERGSRPSGLRGALFAFIFFYSVHILSRAFS